MLGQRQILQRPPLGTPGCTIMLFTVLLRCYHNQDFGASNTSPISRHAIECIGTQFVDDTDLYAFRLCVRSSHDVFLEIQKSMTMWGNLLCSSGGALKPEKCYRYNVDHACNEFSVWDYAEMVN